ncbi:site-specific integrase [Terribacillus saccharophilus]|uniref:site-specific integrase n=1 Tax=Terribacillus saccharophilus TaxID=361277 RepID=UPI002989FDCE|nr:site-specific integrase [Terribacillus saccharophilus]MCM3227534.1 site-specific integrase [Terribacillus saccharophilus]
MAQRNVQPLRTQEEINEMKWALQRFGIERDRFLFIFGINVGLRISDIVPLKVSDVKDAKHVTIREKKTKKVKRFYLNAKLREDIDNYISTLKNDSYLFPSRKQGFHISTVQAYRILTNAGKMLDRDDIGTHTLRKTFGYHHYKKNKDVATLQTLFNHSNPKVTLKYIGITDDEVEATLSDFYL